MSTDRKVLFLTYGFSIGGAEMIIVNLLNYLSTLGFQLPVASLSRPQSLEWKLAPAIKVRHLPRRWKLDFRVVRRIANLVERDDIKLVFALGMFSFFYLRLSYCLLRSKPKTIISLHSTRPRSTKEFLLNYFYARLLRGDEQLVTVCKAQADYLARVYRINRGQFMTIYNGVDTTYFTPCPAGFDRREFRRSLGIAGDAPVIAQVATLRREKKHEDAVRALAIFNKGSTKKAYLLFVGGGDSHIRETLERFVKQLHVSQYVKFCGPQNDVRSYYWISDLFTLSSNAIETFSVAGLEAMACGLPCVLTDQGGAREMIQNGVNGFVVPSSKPEKLADAWARCLNGQLTGSSSRIRDIVLNNFTLERCVRAYEELLTST